MKTGSKAFLIKIRYWVLTLLFFLSVIVYLDRVSISLTGVRIKAELGLSNEQFGWVLAAFALSYALFEVPTGIMGDRLGPRKILTRVVLWWSLFTALTGAANGLISLLVIRFLFGAGEAGAYPNSSIVVSNWFPKSQTGMAQAFIWAARRIGGARARRRARAHRRPPKKDVQRRRYGIPCRRGRVLRRLD